LVGCPGCTEQRVLVVEFEETGIDVIPGKLEWSPTWAELDYINNDKKRVYDINLNADEKTRHFHKVVK